MTELGADCGKAASTGNGSILSIRQTLAAKARTKTRSGNSSKWSASSASSLRTGTFSVTARAATCKPWRWRAAFSKAPAVGRSGATSASGGTWSVGNISLIECAAPIKSCLFGLRKALFQLIGQLQHGHAVSHAVLDLDTQP